MNDETTEASPPSATTYCFHHTNREAGRSCTRCGRPACSDCLHQASVGSHCWECIKSAQPPRTEQLRRNIKGMPSPFASAIVILNIAAFVATNGWDQRSGAPVFNWTINAVDVRVNHEWWRIITSAFVHFGIWHLAVNMFIFYRVMQMFESTLGSLRLVGVYAASLAAGALGALILDPFASTGGASGAVLGTMAALGVALWHRGTSFWNTGFGPMLVITMLWSFVESNVSVGGHLGGIVGGAITGWFFFNLREPRRMVVATAGWITTAVIVATSIAGCLIVSEQKIEDRCKQIASDNGLRVGSGDCDF